VKLRITVTIHSDGTIDVTIEWICTNPSSGKIRHPLLLGIILKNIPFFRKQYRLTPIRVN
jgi:hypothetical protein